MQDYCVQLMFAAPSPLLTSFRVEEQKLFNCTADLIVQTIALNGLLGHVGTSYPGQFQVHAIPCYTVLYC